jgi:hypothetical protein
VFSASCTSLCLTPSTPRDHGHDKAENATLSYSLYSLTNEATEDMDISRGREAPAPDPTPHWTTASPYAKLRNSEIRLIRVLPVSGGSSAPPECVLSTHELTAAPAFKALFYTWGVPHRNIHKLRKTPSSATRRIDCNKLQAHIGENLYDFLSHCAHDASGELQGYIWVDALAINQEDAEERSQQVKLMADIYQSSTSVVVWLGLEDYSTTPAMNLMEGLLQLGSSERQSLHPMQVKENHPNKLLALENWQALSQFYQREWFSRAWM